MATKTMTKPRTSGTQSTSRAAGSRTSSRNSSDSKNMDTPGAGTRTGNTGSGRGTTGSRTASTRSSSSMGMGSGAGTATATMTKPTSRRTASASRTSRSSDKMQAGQEFRKFFVDELKDIYWAEKNIARSLPKMRRAATSEELQAALEKHATETQGHIAVVEKIFGALGEKPKAKKCEAMAGILAESQTVIKDTEKDSFVRDAGLILAVQKVEHYEIATYGTLRIFAQYLKNKRVVTMLEGILSNEKFTDVSLTKLAEGFINDRAARE